MIQGTITSDREAILRLAVRGSSGQEEDVEAVLDTGFNDYLTLPPSLVARLGLSFAAPTQAILADGHVVQLDYYWATINWDGVPRLIPVLASEGGPLIGMSLLYGFDVRLRVLDGGNVTIEAIS